MEPSQYTPVPNQGFHLPPIVLFLLGEEIAALGLLIHPFLLAAAIVPDGVLSAGKNLSLSCLSGLAIGAGVAMAFFASRAATRRFPLALGGIVLLAVWLAAIAVAEFAAGKRLDGMFAPERLDVPKADSYGWGFSPGRRIQVFHPDTGECFEERLNLAGWRDVDHPARKDRVRVLLLGDEAVWGSGLSFDQTVAADVRKRLGEKFEVFAMGYPNFSTDQEYLALAREGVRARPDHVVLLIALLGDVFENGRDHALFGNAPKPGFDLEAGKLVPRPFPAKEPSRMRRVFGRSRLCVALRLYLARASGRNGPPARSPATLDPSRHELYIPPTEMEAARITPEMMGLFDSEWTPERRREWELTLAILKAMRDECDKRNALLTVYAYRQYPDGWNFKPEKSALWNLKAPDPQKPFRLLREFAQAEGIHYIEEPESLRMGFLLGDYTFRSAPFLNHRGAARMGELIARHIQSQTDNGK